MLLALLVAFAGVVVVLVSIDYLAYRLDGDGRQLRHNAVQAMVQTLPDDEAGARLVITAGERQYNLLRRRASPERAPQLQDLLWQLTDLQQQRVVYASAALGAQALPATTGDVVTVDVAGRHHRLAQAQSGRWQLAMLEPVINDLTALQWLLQSSIGSIAIAFPVVLLPVWIAVRRALLPLRQLVAAVTGRAPGDFSPLTLDLRLAELKPLADTLNELFRRSREALARERSLVHDAAHELRTPLAVIATQAHALAAAPDAATRQPAQARLEQAVQRASHQVHQVLTLARVEGAAARAAEALELVESLRQALIDADPQARARGIELALEAPDALHATLDRVAWHSIVDNLLNNALLHARGATRVQLDLAADGTRLRLCVRDDGAGIADSDRARLFERFHRGRDTTAPGSGLGLSIVREAARLLGGDVELQPHGLDGRGAGFEVSLPLPAGTGHTVQR